MSARARPAGCFRGIAAIACAALLAPAAARAADAAAGKTLFLADCATCHGPSGKGDGPVGKALSPPPRDFSQHQFKFDTDKDGKAGTDADLKAVIQKGAAAFGGSPLMAPWPTLSDSDIANLIAYLHTL
jgi:mono/diheme cytochrome c family protein